MSKFGNEINSILKDIHKCETEKQQLLYSKTVNFLKIIALKYAADKNDYEDILVEAYLRMFRYIYSFNPNKDGYNWMCKIVQNVANDFNTKLHPTLPLDEITFTGILGDELDRVIDKDDLLAKICGLSDREQNIIYLRFYEKCTYSEIAKILNSKKSTVHKQLGSILKKLEK